MSSTELLDDMHFLTDPPDVYAILGALLQRRRAGMAALGVPPERVLVTRAELACACRDRGIGSARFESALETLVYSGVVDLDAPYVLATFEEGSE